MADVRIDVLQDLILGRSDTPDLDGHDTTPHKGK